MLSYTREYVLFTLIIPCLIGGIGIYIPLQIWQLPDNTRKADKGVASMSSVSNFPKILTCQSFQLLQYVQISHGNMFFVLSVTPQF